ncbi:MAG: DUF2079 domain-containing protein [Spirochaetia bacterium]|nr:DUF2079 domain-containing protein [Spirochaetia bacterium]
MIQNRSAYFKYLLFLTALSIPSFLSFFTEPIKLSPYGINTDMIFILPVWILSKSERFLSYVFFASGIILYFLYRKKRRDRIPMEFFPEEGRLITLTVFLPILFHNFIFTLNSYESLYIGDFDYTMISSALNRTVRGDGFLRTAFVNTGSGGSFLGHHFTPSLILYLPLYVPWDFIGNVSITLVPDHFLYGALLWITLFTGAIFWNRLNSFLFKSPEKTLIANTVIALAFPLWRISYSFHFEILVFPLSALLFLSYFKKEKSYWVYLALMLGVKEDISIYMACFGIFLVFSGSGKKGILTSVSSVLYFAGAMLIRNILSGEDVQNFSEYFSIDFRFKDNIKTSFTLLFSLAFLPVFNLKFFLFTILPILILHGFSKHPWHFSFYGHYIYTVLPFLFLGVSLAVKDLLDKRRQQYSYFMIFSFILSMVFYAAAGDKGNPSPGFLPDRRFSSVSDIMHKIPENSCVRTQIPFTAHVPLHSRSYPLFLPHGSPETNRYIPFCRIEIFIADFTDPRPPYYTKEMLHILKGSLDRNKVYCGLKNGIMIYAESKKTCLNFTGI